MRRLLGIVISFVVLGAILVGWMGVMSETHPYSPGNLLYPLQYVAEQVRISIEHTSADRAYYAMEIFDRQVAALAKTQNEQKVERISKVLIETLEVALRHIENTPFSQQPEVLAELQQKVHNADIVISAITISPEMTYMVRLNQIIAALVAEDGGSLNTMRNNSLSQVVIVPFLSGDVAHMKINLRGGHTRLECETCHAQGKYAQTQYQCDNCHNNPSRLDTLQVALAEGAGPDGIVLTNPYPNHFQGNCIDCHNVNSWQSIDFDHSQAVECDSCHTLDVPKEDPVWLAGVPTGEELFYKTDAASTKHYSGPCLRCHNDTSSWSVISFTHQTYEACENCHSGDTPVDHYSGECIVCHKNTDDWLDTAHHDGYTDCASCHQDVLPDDHYTGQCYYCHFPSDWNEIVFDHTGYTECTSCHVGPEGHYTSQCARCHNTLSWFDVTTAHDGSASCTSCHRSQVPANHYDGECSLCHSFDSWGNPSFDHNIITAPTCINCHADDSPAGHYDYECSRCHIPGSWTAALRYDHINANECLDCHNEDTPNSHYEGLCSNCHGVMSWVEGIHFDHTGYTVCTNCHTVAQPHYVGECTSCHNTTSWDDISFIHDATSDCITCHTAPEGHYPDACTDCHNTSSWTVATVDHVILPSDCTLCHIAPDEHYLNSCTTCHNTTDWKDVDFNHTSDYDNCTGCHVAPDGHWPGQCSGCHTVYDWADIYFDHTDYTNCKSCHVRPDGHPRGQCSICHNTSSWETGKTSLDPSPYDPEPPSSVPTPDPAQDD